jgi:hypothetical protein
MAGFAKRAKADGMRQVLINAQLIALFLMHNAALWG